MPQSFAAAEVLQEAYFHFYSGNAVHLESLLPPMSRRILRDQQVKAKQMGFLNKERLSEIVKQADCEKKEGADYPNLPCTFLVKPYYRFASIEPPIRMLLNYTPPFPILCLLIPYSTAADRLS